MAFTNSNVSFSVLFSPAADRRSGTVTITDTSPLVGAGISLANVAMAINGWAPDSAQFKTGNLGSPDVADESVTRAFSFNLPLDVNGYVQEGNYQFQLLLRVGGGVDPGDYNSAKLTYELCIECPTAALTPDVDCLCGIITVSDDTSYSGWTTTSRTMTLYAPNPESLTHAPVTSTGLTVSTVGEDIFTGTYSARLQWTGTKDNLRCTIDYTLEFKSQCDFDMCELQCCVEALETRRQNARDQLVKEETQRLMSQVAVYLVMIRQAAECGRTSQVSAYVDRIRALTGCTTGCGCSDGTVPTRIVPVCSPTAGSAITIQDDGVYTLITLVGSTYTVSLTQVQKDILNNTRNYIVESADASITVTSSTNTATTPDTITYDLSVSDQSIPWMQLVLTLSFSGTGLSLPTPSISMAQLRGGIYQIPTFTFSTSTPNLLVVNNFYSGAAGKGAVRVDIANVTYNALNTAATDLQDYIDLEGKGRTATQSTFWFQKMGTPPTGAYATWLYLDYILTELQLIVTITEIP